MRWDELGKLCTIKSGGTPPRNQREYWGGEVPWAKISDLDTHDGGALKFTEEKISITGLEAIHNRIFPAGTILLAIYGSVGKTAVLGVESSCNQAILGIQIEDTTALNPEYLLLWLRSVGETLMSQAKGVAQKNISLKHVKELKVPLPPLEEQKRIARILDEADLVRKKTQALIDKYDELAQSLFLDMFGDPVTNPKGWEVKPLGDLFQISTGKTPSTKDSENFNGNIPFVTPPDFNSDDEIARFVSESGAAQSRIVPKGSLLVTCIGSIGKTKIVNTPSCFNQQINAIEIGSGWHPEVLQFALQRMKSVLEAAASATTVPILNKGNFQKIKVFVPPAEVQESFTSNYRQIQRGVEELKSAKKQGQALFNALLQKAFKGELT
jgi:type I restriction enzyme S subunit